MKAIIVREVRALIFKPVASTSAAAQANLSALNQSGQKINTHIRFDDEPQSKATSSRKHKEFSAMLLAKVAELLGRDNCAIWS